MSMLQRKAINANIYQVYTPGDQYHLANRVPEVGSAAIFQDGREYKFCSFAAAGVVGQTVAEAVSVLTGVAVGTNAAGATSVTVTLAGVTANQFAGGLFLEQTGGYIYPVKSNTVSGTANLVTLELEQPLVAAITAAAQLTLTSNACANVVVGTATNDIIGFSVVAASIGDLAWVQTAGLGSVVDEGVSAGAAIMAAAAGATSTQSAGKKQIGTVIAVGTGFALTQIG